MDMLLWFVPLNQVRPNARERERKH